MDSPTSTPSQGEPQSEALGGLPPSFRIPPEPKPWPAWLRIILPLLIFVAGGGLAAYLILTRPSTPHEDKPQSALPVELEPIEVGEHLVVVHAQGTVRPAQQVVLQPEITGRITWLADDLVLGGRLQEGQTVARIDPRDYQLAVRQQQAQVGNQALVLRVEKARQEVAEQEWKLYQRERQELGESRDSPAERRGAALGDGRDEDQPATAEDVLEGGELALREPQVKSAEIGLQSARSGLARARLQLSRTTLRAPFNALVQSEAVEVGQLVGPASQLATLVGTDAYWVQVSLPLDELTYLHLPTDDHPGSPARVWFEAGGQTVERFGRIVRLLGDLDPVGRMARLLVRIDDPLGLEQSSSGANATAGAAARQPAPGLPPTSESATNGRGTLPLLLGSFVHVELRGKTLQNVAEIPTRALQPEDRVYLFGPGGKLEIRAVEVLLRSAETTVVRGRLADGDRVVTSPISAPVEGMALRVLTGAEAPSPSGERSSSAPATGASTASAAPSVSADASRGAER